MLSRVSALRSLKSLNPAATGTYSVVSRRWENKSSVPTSSPGSATAAAYNGPVLKAWEEHPDLTTYELTDGTKALMYGHNFIAHRPFKEGSGSNARSWSRAFRFIIPVWIAVAYYAGKNFEIKPYFWYPIVLANLSQFNRDNYLQYKTDANHYYQNYDEDLSDPNEEDDEDEDEDED